MSLSLGILPTAYVVMACQEVPTSLSSEFTTTPQVASLNDAILIFASFQEAKSAAIEYIAKFPYSLPDEPTNIIRLPKYVWVSPIYQLWIGGIQQ